MLLVSASTFSAVAGSSAAVCSSSSSSLGADEGSHEQGKRLPLPAGEQPHRLLHAVLQPHVQQSKLFAEERLILAGDAGEDGVGCGACPQVGQRQIFLNGHVGRGALERVLK